MSQWSPDKDPDIVFVYGTLQRGGVYHYWMRRCQGEFIGMGSLCVSYPLLLALYPCLLDEPGKGYHVEGEVYRISTLAGWRDLDRLEGHPHEYRRRLELVELDGRRLQAWTYFYVRGDVPYGSLPAVNRFDPKVRGPDSGESEVTV